MLLLDRLMVSGEQKSGGDVVDSRAAQSATAVEAARE
jgi:hypothetical protein